MTELVQVTRAELFKLVRRPSMWVLLAASVFHYGEFTIAQAKTAMRAAGIEIRETVQ